MVSNHFYCLDYILLVNFEDIMNQISSLNSAYYRKKVERVSYEDVFSNISDKLDNIDPVLDNSNTV